MRRLLLSLFILIQFQLYAGSDLDFPLIFSFLTEKEGLANNTINDITQDNEGYIWIATEDGLYRYDGRHFKVYRHEFQDSTSLPSNAVLALKLIDHSLWILTDHGLAIYDRERNAFKNPLGKESNDIKYGSYNSIISVGNNVILGTFERGVWVYENEQIHPLIENIESIDSGALSITSIAYNERDRKLWIGTYGDGLFQFDFKTERLKQTKELKGKRIFSIHIDEQLVTWVGTNESVFRIKNSKDIVKLDLPKDDYLSIYKSKSVLLVGSRSQGLYLGEQDNGENDFFSFRNISVSSYEDGTSSRTISKIYLDRDENYWLGTHNGGVNFLSSQAPKILYHHQKDDQTRGLSYPSAWGMELVSEDEIWIGTDGNGIDSYDPIKNSFSRKDWLNSKLSDAAILNIKRARSGNLWVGTYEGGIMKIDIAKESIDYYLSDYPSKDVRCIAETNDGRIIIGTNGGGALVYDEKKDSFSSLKGLEGLDIRSFVESDNDVLWIATYGDGLLKYNMLTSSVQRFNWYEDRASEFIPIVLSMLKSENSLWLGTKYAGLVMFDLAKEEFTQYTENEGLINNTVRSIIQDDLSKLWLSTNNGVSCFDLKREVFRNFTAKDGFQAGQFNNNSALKLPSGEIIFGGIHGFNQFKPDLLIKPSGRSEFRLNSISVFSSEESEPLVFSSPEIGKTVYLDHDQNMLTCSFSLFKYPFNEGSNLEVLLEGSGNRWQELDENLSITYRNLNPGNYKVKARILGETETEYASLLNIRIDNPWWFKWYAYLAYLSALVGLITLIVRYTNRQVRLQAKLNFEQKLRIQEQSEFDQKVRFFTNFSHELRTPLTLISNPVMDLLSRFDNTHEQKHLLKIIQRNSKAMMKLVNRLLEYRKVELERNTLHIGYHDINILVQEEVEAFQYQANTKRIKIHLITTSQLMAWLDIEKLQIILNNLLNNAVKYAPKNGNIWLQVSQNSNNTISLKVSDDGKGVKESDIKNIFKPFYQAENAAKVGGTGIGLSLCKSLAELHSGSIDGNMNEHGGLTVEVKIPINRKDYEDLPHVQFIENVKDLEEMDSFDLQEKELGIKDVNDKIVLIADDNKEIADYLVTLFKDDFSVFYASDGQEALKKTNQLIPDIVISDIMMPEIDGIELCKTIKSQESTQHIPVILLTAKDQPESRLEGFETGADDYIVKPFQSEMVKARVNALIQSRELLRESLNVSKDKPGSTEEEYSEELKFLRKAEDQIIQFSSRDNFSVPALAKELGYSRTSLYRKIKALTGQSINQFVRAVRMKKAAELLSSRDLNVSEVAFSLGYTDLKYFRSCFKDHYNMLPSDYQKKYFKSDIDPDALKSAMNLDY